MDNAAFEGNHDEVFLFKLSSYNHDILKFFPQVTTVPIGRPIVPSMPSPDYLSGKVSAAMTFRVIPFNSRMIPS